MGIGLSLLNQGMAEMHLFFESKAGMPWVIEILKWKTCWMWRTSSTTAFSIFIGNRDWPGRNHWYGRDRTEPGISVLSGTRKQRWDLGSDLQTNITGASSSVAAPYAALRANALFRQWFEDRAHQHFPRVGPFMSIQTYLSGCLPPKTIRRLLASLGWLRK